jgi:lipopolysaccharide export system protein LptC
LAYNLLPAAAWGRLRRGIRAHGRRRGTSLVLSHEGNESTLMYRVLRNTLGALVLISAAVATWYWRRPAPSPSIDTTPPSVPLGYYLTDAVLLGTDETGRVFYQISADRAEEHPEEQRLVLSNVRMRYMPSAEIPWRAKATSGEAPADASYLILEGKVELTSEPEDGGQPTVIQTTSLRLVPEAFLASSEQPVDVLLGSEELNAVGIKAYLKDNRLELESKVHGLFTP